MRRRARTDLCGGRSVMVVPTATPNSLIAGFRATGGLIHILLEPPATHMEFNAGINSVATSPVNRRAARVTDMNMPYYRKPFQLETRRHESRATACCFGERRTSSARRALFRMPPGEKGFRMNSPLSSARASSSAPPLT